MIYSTPPPLSKNDFINKLSEPFTSYLDTQQPTLTVCGRTVFHMGFRIIILQRGSRYCHKGPQNITPVFLGPPRSSRRDRWQSIYLALFLKTWFRVGWMRGWAWPCWPACCRSAQPPPAQCPHWNIQGELTMKCAGCTVTAAQRAS